MACMCAGDTAIENHTLSDYDAIFTGKLISAKHFDEIAINDSIAFPAEIDSFEIIKVWKGEVSKKEKIAIFQFGIGCTNSLKHHQVGDEVIIGAFYSRDTNFQGFEHFLQTSLCALIIPASYSNDYNKAIQFLNNQYRANNSYKILVLIIGVLALLIVVIVSRNKKY